MVTSGGGWLAGRFLVDIVVGLARDPEDLGGDVEDLLAGGPGGLGDGDRDSIERRAARERAPPSKELRPILVIVFYTETQKSAKSEN